jgi:hypothetical protein
MKTFEWVPWLVGLLGGLALAGCREEGGVSVPPPPELSAPAEGKPAGEAAAAKGAEAASATPAAPEPALWTCPERKPTNPEQGVAVGVDIAGAAPGMESPIPFFLKLCADRYDCGLEAIQAPGQVAAQVLTGKSQTDADLLKSWRTGIARAPRLETRVQAWTSAWLDKASGPPVAIIWYDGITDEDNANGVVDEAHLGQIGGVWALPGTLTQKGRGTPLLIYVLARKGHVDHGAKVAADLNSAAGGATYTIAFEQPEPLELFPGTTCLGEATVSLVDAPADPFKGAAVRRIFVGAATEPLSGTPVVASLPTTVRFASGKYSDKSVALEPLAAAWAASPAKDPALPGIRVSVAIKGTPPAALPSDVFAPISDWRWEARAEGEGRLPWGFDANNSSADFRAKVAVVRACSEVGGGGHLLGVHDALACRKVSDGTVGPSCGPQTASQLAGILMNPAVEGLLKRAPAAPCAGHMLHVPTPDARDKVPSPPRRSRSGSPSTVG